MATMTTTGTTQRGKAQAAGKDAIRPFTVNVPEAELTELRQRIIATRYPERETVADDTQGVQLDTIQKLARYWATEYDWRRVEAKLNSYPNFLTEIDGLDIHFMHIRSKHENALPLIPARGAGAGLGTCVRRISGGDLAEAHEAVARLAEESLREARERVWEMRISAAAGDDLATALETIARDRTAGMPIAVEVITTGSPRPLPAALEDAAFRIGREAIVNVVRHAGASRIEIHLDFHNSTFRLEVGDDGRGLSSIEADEARRHGHFGLGGMRDRAIHLGGRCEVRPRPGGGTIVALELPLEQVRI